MVLIFMKMVLYMENLMSNDYLKRLLSLLIRTQTFLLKLPPYVLSPSLMHDLHNEIEMIKIVLKVDEQDNES